MSNRLARVVRAIRAYYNWDDDVTSEWKPTARERFDAAPGFEEWKALNPAPEGLPGVDHFTPERGWQGTYSGGKFYPLSPQTEHVTIEDLAHGLAMTCRYNGQCKRYYSVAEHCVIVSANVDPKYALEALLHDAAEAYIGDMVRPLKHQPEMLEFRRAEAEIEVAVFERFNIKSTAESHAEVKRVDNRVLADEILQLMPVPALYTDVLEQQPLGVNIQCWDPYTAERMYLQRYYELTLASRTRTL